jgi:hypothetical protein
MTVSDDLMIIGETPELAERRQKSRCEPHREREAHPLCPKLKSRALLPSVIGWVRYELV